MPTSGNGPHREDGDWELPIAAGLVVQLRIDFAFWLVVDSREGDVSCEIRIGSPLRYQSDRTSQTIDPERTEQLAPLLTLRMATVHGAFALEDGHLQLHFDEGRAITVPPDPMYEAWELTLTNRSTNRTHGLISLPGSGMAVTESVQQPVATTTNAGRDQHEPRTMVPVMNNTKWNEVRMAMLGLDPRPRWRTRDRHNGFVSSWDGEWYHHFRDGGYDSIEWVEIRPTQLAQLPVVVEILREIGVAGHVHDDSVITVYGYVERGVDIEWL